MAVYAFSRNRQRGELPSKACKSASKAKAEGCECKKVPEPRTLWPIHVPIPAYAASVRFQLSAFVAIYTVGGAKCCEDGQIAVHSSLRVEGWQVA